MKKALAMALAIMCVLALAGCGTNPAKEVLPWMQNLKADDISEVQVWNMSTAEDLKKVLTKEETAELVALLNALSEDDFQDNSALRGSTPDYGMDIVVDGEHIGIWPSGSSREGALRTDCKGEWFIDNDALTDFVRSVTAVESFDAAA